MYSVVCKIVIWQTKCPYVIDTNSAYDPINKNNPYHVDLHMIWIIFNKFISLPFGYILKSLIEVMLHIQPQTLFHLLRHIPFHNPLHL